MNREELRKYVANDLGVNESDLVWSKYCRNPLSNYHHEDGTIKGSEGYYVLKNK